MNKKKKLIAAKFIKYILTPLGINRPFRVQLVTQRDDSLKTYAFYDPATGLIKVYVKGRGMADILRSIAHEFVHHRQNQDGRVTVPHQDVGGELENEANASSGVLIKQFGYKFPDFKIYEL